VIEDYDYEISLIAERINFVVIIIIIIIAVKRAVCEPQHSFRRFCQMASGVHVFRFRIVF
jgi:hypothetical protein